MKYLLSFNEDYENFSVVAQGQWPTDELDAIDESILKWKFVVKVLRTIPLKYPLRVGEQSCALCQLYIEGECERCPVAEKTGETNCQGTPFESYTDATIDVNDQNDQDEALKAAKAEVRFLEGLTERRKKEKNR